MEASLSVPNGVGAPRQVSTVLTVTRGAGFAEDVTTVQAVNLPVGVGASCGPLPITVETVSCVLTFTVLEAAEVTSAITIEASTASGSVARTALSLTVTRGDIGVSAVTQTPSTISSAPYCNELATQPGSVTIGETTIAVGYRNPSGFNKNPVVTRCDAGSVTWSRDDLDTTADDVAGYGLVWDGGETLYVVFSCTFHYPEGADFRDEATNGWLRSNGQGAGSPKSVIVRLSPATGEPQVASYLSAVLSNGQSNAFRVSRIRWTGQEVVLNAQTGARPRRTERTAMVCEEGRVSPFNYQLRLSADLTTALGATADGCQ
jgi:hypothetical protein